MTISGVLTGGGADLKGPTKGKTRVIVTPRVSKHRLFIWAPPEVVPDSRLFVIARDDDYFWGVLSSRVHEVWTLNTCSWHGVGNDPTYNAATCFRGFPFPWPPDFEPDEDSQKYLIAANAKDLNQKRETWLNPANSDPVALKSRTLTKLYNSRPTWLAEAHRALDASVLRAYGWPDELSDADILGRLLSLNMQRRALPQPRNSNV
jgi:type II restriction/modification system DNA methylase subunit YeeA